MEAEDRKVVKQPLVLSSSPEQWHAIAAGLKGEGKHFEALVAYKTILDLNPNDAVAHAEFAGLCVVFHDTARALKHYNIAIQLSPQHLPAYAQLSWLLLEKNNFTLALSVLEMAERFSPLSPEIMDARIKVLQSSRRVGEALTLCKEALTRYPEHDVFFCALAELSDLSSDDPEVKKAKKQLEKRGNASTNAPSTALAIARVYDHAGRTESAFSYFRRANRWKAERFPYDEPQKRAMFDALCVSFADSSHPVSGVRGPNTPVFILGMPRSGTTLVEQVLDSHPLIHGAGEMTSLSDLAFGVLPQLVNTPFPACIPLIDASQPEHYDKHAASILAALHAHWPQAAFVCNKMPQNFLYIGLILRLFPTAKIIHCRRDAMDTCFSIYTNHFQGHHEYGYDLGTLGRYYRMYDALMRHWESLYPGAIHTVHYERLVEDFEPETRGLLDYLGAEWDDACLRFYENKRTVRTASRDQVNKPLYASSIGRWKAYEKYLGPLKEALGDLVV